MATDTPASSALHSVVCPQRIAPDTIPGDSVARLESAGASATSRRKLMKYAGQSVFGDPSPISEFG